MILHLGLHVVPREAIHHGCFGPQHQTLCAGFYAYIASSWEPARKAAFYGVHRPLGLLGLLSGLLAVLLGLCESQMYIIASGGLVSFTTSAAYAAGSIMQPVLGVILFLQAIAVVAAVTLRKQYLPAPGASTKEAALP